MLLATEERSKMTHGAITIVVNQQEKTALHTVHTQPLSSAWPIYVLDFQL